MPVFDDILNNAATPERFGPLEGFAGVLLCASACDGHIGDEEGASMNLILGQKKLYERLTPHQFGSMVDRLIGLLKRGGPERLLNKSYPAVPPELRGRVFANAVDIVLADGKVEQEERESIDGLKGKLEIDEKRAKTIVQVMVYKNHG